MCNTKKKPKNISMCYINWRFQISSNHLSVKFAGDDRIIFYTKENDKMLVKKNIFLEVFLFYFYYIVVPSKTEWKIEIFESEKKMPHAKSTC